MPPDPHPPDPHPEPFFSERVLDRRSGGARERTALAWTRSALNMAAIGVLIARGAFEGHLDGLAVASGLALAALTGLTWNRGRIIYRVRRGAGTQVAVETETFWLLTLATVGVALLAIVVTVLD